MFVGMVGATIPETPKPRLLYVDDEAGVRAALRRQLRRSFQLALASDADEALDWLSRSGAEVDVIATDFSMPGMDGLAFLREASQRVPLVSQILVSGALGEDTVLRALNEGPVFHVLTKPWRIDKLSAVLRRAAARTALLRDNAARLQRLEAEKTGLESYVDVLENEREASLARLLTVLREAVAGWPGADRAASARAASFCARLVGSEALAHLPADALLRVAPLWGMVARAPLRTRLASLLAGIPELAVETSLLSRGADTLAGEITIDLLGPATGITSDLNPRATHELVVSGKVLRLVTALEAASEDPDFDPSRDWPVACQEALRRSGCEDEPDIVAAVEEMSREELTAAWASAGR